MTCAALESLFNEMKILLFCPLFSSGLENSTSGMPLGPFTEVFFLTLFLCHLSGDPHSLYDPRSKIKAIFILGPIDSPQDLEYTMLSGAGEI